MVLREITDGLRRIGVALGLPTSLRPGLIFVYLSCYLFLAKSFRSNIFNIQFKISLDVWICKPETKLSFKDTTVMQSFVHRAHAIWEENLSWKTEQNLLNGILMD